jgi:hypothetical protein
MKKSNQSLNEMGTLGWTIALAGGYITMKVLKSIIFKFFAKKIPVKKISQFVRDRSKLKQAGVPDEEIDALYANKGAGINKIQELIRTKYAEDIYQQVRTKQITAEQGVMKLSDDLELGDPILKTPTEKQDMLKMFKSLQGQQAKSASLVPYTKVAGSILPKDETFKKAVIKTYGQSGDVDRLYQSYQNAMQSNKLAIPFKNKSVFPSKQEWLSATGYKPKNAVISLNDKLIAQTNAYNWHKFIWTLYR